MKSFLSSYIIIVAFLSLVFFPACQGQIKQNSSTLDSKGLQSVKTLNQIFKPKLDQNYSVDTAIQVGEYLREIFQDTKGDLWFGTLTKGVARYNQVGLIYYSKKHGLVGNQINGIAEDISGNIWFATTEGVSRYDGKEFTNFTINEGLIENRVWSILADSQGNVWVGTMKGVCLFNGNSFISFPIPVSDVENPTFLLDLKCVTSMIEDSKGNIWFARDGYGVSKYDGDNFIHYTQEDGLCSNSVGSVQEDRDGNLWFGSVETRVPEADKPYSFIPSGNGGLSRYDGSDFTKFPKIPGLSNNDIGPIYKDKSGNIWIASKHFGVYKYDGKRFYQYQENQKNTNNCIQSILEDKEGKLWFGFSGGLFRLNDSKFENITKEGPWKYRKT